MRRRAPLAVSPAISAYAARAPALSRAPGGSGSIRPSGPMMGRTGSSSSRHQVTSTVSPNVQTMAMPVPLAGSARAWASTGTSVSNSGTRTVEPKSGR